MKLKSFNEFISSLTRDDMDYINGVNNDDVPKLKTDSIDHESLTKIIAFSNGLSFGMDLRLLELYHDWLSEQFQQFPFRLWKLHDWTPCYAE